MSTVRGTKWVLAAALAGAMLAGAAAARADCGKGQAAWDAGRHVEAAKEWEAAARANDACAMLALGRAFAKGLGVPQDFVEAHSWLNLAAGRGSAEAAAERDALAAKMTVEEQAEARKLARAWRKRGRQAVSAPASDPGWRGKGPPPGRALREAQALLAALGYRPGPADGKWGARSVQAYRNFLRDAGMQPSDLLTSDTLRTMRRTARDRGVKARKASMSREALHRAARSGDIDGLKAVLATRPDVNARDGRGWTALMHAVDKGYTLLVPLLLRARADPDIRAADGATALFIAASHRHSEIIALLIDAGADLSVKGPRGKTIGAILRTNYGGFHRAREEGQEKAIVKILHQYGLTAEDTQDTVAFLAKRFTECHRFPSYQSMWSAIKYPDWYEVSVSSSHGNKLRILMKEYDDEDDSRPDESTEYSFNPMDVAEVRILLVKSKHTKLPLDANTLKRRYEYLRPILELRTDGKTEAPFTQRVGYRSDTTYSVKFPICSRKLAFSIARALTLCYDEFVGKNACADDYIDDVGVDYTIFEWKVFKRPQRHK